MKDYLNHIIPSLSSHMHIPLPYCVAMLIIMHRLGTGRRPCLVKTAQESSLTPWTVELGDIQELYPCRLGSRTRLLSHHLVKCLYFTMMLTGTSAMAPVKRQA